MTFQVDRYQGDPKIFITIDGAEMVVKGGQPIMDGGLENAANISLLTEEGWYGNYLIADPNQHIGARFLNAVKQAVTLSMLVDSTNAMGLALQWMIDTSVASKVTPLVRNPEGRIIVAEVTIEPPGQDIQKLLLTNNGNNWIVQKIDPASGKV